MSLEDEVQEEEPKDIKPSFPKQKARGTKKIQVVDENPSKTSNNESRSLTEQWFDDGELVIDVYQTGNDIVLQSAIAGVKPEDLDIAIENDMVTIKGERSNSVKEEKKDYIHQECFWGSFSRQVILPEEVDANRAEASFQDGILTLRLPKLSRQKVKKIKLA